MTVDEWLLSRTPPAPEALRARVRSALDGRASAAADGAHDACMAAAEDLLTALLDARKTGRESALDLLAVDALVTYAVEQAAASPGLDGWAAAAMARIADIGARYTVPAP
ncbi:MAG TPA: hypothetical protein VG818_09050 [Gemmatimonadaceae bacterium]|nr:hypothetical protein [Gemmatimonadaceae bacterium]